MVYRCIASEWLRLTGAKAVLEGEFTDERLAELNKQGYNIYYFPNCPSMYDPSKPVDGAAIDTFNYVFVDLDLKHGKYASIEDFVERLFKFKLSPTLIVGSGNGVHAYWQVSDLDAIGYLRLQRRLCRYFDTDEAVSKICQLMRLPETYNTKEQDNFKQCEILYSGEDDKEIIYTSEQLDSALPIITKEDESYCQRHYNSTYKTNTNEVTVPTALPLKFANLLRDNTEVQRIWTGNTEDRSEADYRLGHVLFAYGFTKEEALAVLTKTIKAQDRAPAHQVSYAQNIIDKIWTYEIAPADEKPVLLQNVKDILAKNKDSEAIGTRFPCWPYLDDTKHGFRIGQLIGLVAGAGVGKTSMSLNMFMGFVKNNPNYDHLFVPLEQPVDEIAERWKTMCGNQTHLHEKVQLLSNYNPDGTYRHLSLDDIQEHIKTYETKTGRKIGCVVIDHIGVLKGKNKNGMNESLMEICHKLKPFALSTQTMLVIQSQAPREKAGIGDIELNKDAAYGTLFFEAYCDYLITIWQPLKRCYNDARCPTVMSFKFGKIRHKKVKVDKIQEDIRYNLYFDTNKELLRELTEEEETAFSYFNQAATNLRKLDKKTDVLTYVSRKVEHGEANNNQDDRRSIPA